MQENKTSNVNLIFGIISLVLALIAIFVPFLSIPAIIFGILSLAIKTGNSTIYSKVCGWIGVITSGLVILYMIIVLVFVGSAVKKISDSYNETINSASTIAPWEDGYSRFSFD